MNKKALFLILLVCVLISPVVALAVGAGDIANNIQNAAIDIGFPIIVVGWVVAGILYLTSAGSPEKTGIAKKALVACVIGTVLVILALKACVFINTLFGLGGACA